MKKILVASVLASVGMAVYSYGQGQVSFVSYDFGATSLNAPVTFATSGVDASSGNGAVTAGWGVGSTFTADLLFQYGTMTTFALATSATPFAYNFSGNGPIGINDLSSYAGYFFGDAVTINNAAAPYSGGTISFIVEAYNGASYAASGTGTGIWRGQSSVFTGTAATGLSAPTSLAFSGFTVTTSAVPEPSTLALAGLGGFGMLMAMRRKKA